jgi:hypothetical protein
MDQWRLRFQQVEKYGRTEFSTPTFQCMIEAIVLSVFKDQDPMLLLDAAA